MLGEWVRVRGGSWAWDSVLLTGGVNLCISVVGPQCTMGGLGEGRAPDSVKQNKQQQQKKPQHNNQNRSQSLGSFPSLIFTSAATPHLTSPHTLSHLDWACVTPVLTPSFC